MNEQNPHYAEPAVPRRFAVSAKGFTFILSTVAAMVIVETLTPGTDSAYELGPVDAVLALGWLSFLAHWLLRGGWVTLDFSDKSIIWRRPIFGASREWRFSDVTAATARTRAAGDVVVLWLPDSRLALKVSRGSAVGLAAYLSSGR